MSELHLDLRGLRCPWPALRAARALREADAGTEIVAMADDPAAPGEIEAVTIARGWTFSLEQGANGPIFRLRR